MELKPKERGERISRIIYAIEKEIEQAREQAREQALEEAAKFMEDYGCTACNHFDHDGSPDLIRALKK